MKTVGSGESKFNKQNLFIVAFFVLATSFINSTVRAQTALSELTKVNLKQDFSGTNGAQFGTDVAIDGNWMIASAPDFSFTGNPASKEGTAFIFARDSNGGWGFQQQLAPDIVRTSSRAGACVDISGDTAIVGVPGGSPFVQSLYIFTRTGTSWTQQQRLTASGYGNGCSISGDSIITSSFTAGSPTADILIRSGGVWSVQATLSPILGSNPPIFFGYEVAIDGDTAVVGLASDDSVQVFVRTGVTWMAQQRVVSNPSGGGFARSVALDGDTLIAGALSANGVSSGTGAAFVFVRSGNVWTQQQKLFAADARPQSLFGISVAIKDNTAIVGSAFNNTPTGGGAAFVFQRSGNSWTEAQKIFPVDTKSGDAFGFSTDLSNSQAVIGSVGDYIGPNASGSAYVFTTNPASCTFALTPSRSTLLPADAGMGTFMVTTQSGCAWQATAQDNVSWATTTSAGTGSGTVNFNVAANAGKARRAEITVNGRQIYTTNQAGSIPSQEGDLDPSFGNVGLMTTKVLQINETNGVAVQPDGKVVLAGGSFTSVPVLTMAISQLIRYTANGLLDASFDGDGIVTTAVGGTTIGNSSGFFDVLIQPDGKIVGAGSASSGGNQDFGIVRYNANGSLDTSFGTGGMTITGFGSSFELASGLAITPDGKLIVSGSDFSGNVLLARYNANGTLDTSFDGDGKLSVPDGRSFTDVAVQADGKIVVVAMNESSRTIVLRHNVNGTPDTTFDGDGRSVIEFSGGNAIGLAPNGKIIVGLNGGDAGGRIDFAVARLNSNGSLDLTFDVDGVAQANFGYPEIGESHTTDVLRDIALQADGKILAVGSVQSNQGSTLTHAGIVRFNANGSIDENFAGLGRGTTAREGFQLLDVVDTAKAMALQPDGNIVVAGDYVSRARMNDVMVLRFLGTPIRLDLIFASGFEG